MLLIFVLKSHLLSFENFQLLGTLEKCREILYVKTSLMNSTRDHKESLHPNYFYSRIEESKQLQIQYALIILCMNYDIS